MIYTLTLNPALDYLVDVKEIKLNSTNRSDAEHLSFGGKGINVSYVLNQLGVESVCLGFVAGFTGKELERMLENEKIKTDFVHLSQGNTRINVKINGEEITEINANGPAVFEEDLIKLFQKLEKLSEGDVLLLAGSLPAGVSENLYEKIMELALKKQVEIVVDTSGKKLTELLKYKPFLIKPNIDELCEIAGKNLCTENDIIDAAFDLKKAGAVNVLVSRGKDGAILVDEQGKIHKTQAVKIISRNATGAGDSMVAGFLSGLDMGYEYALKLGNACGAATAASTTLAKKEEIEKLMK